MTKSQLHKQSKEKCLICGQRQEIILENVFDTRFGIEEPYDISRCLMCNLEQIYPLPSADDLKSLYETYYNFSGKQNALFVKIRERFLSSFLYKIWIKIDGDISFYLVKGSGLLLDIGCNEGRGLNIYCKNGFQAEGLELNEVAAKAAKDRGFTVHTKLLEDFYPDQLYDVIVLSNVLEHSLNPREMLTKIYTLLKPDGKIWISCPNNQSFIRNTFGDYWINWHIPFHIVQFSPVALDKILFETGFANIKILQKTPSIWVAYSIVSRLFFKPGVPTKELQYPILIALLTLFIRAIMFPFLFLINKTKRGDCITVEAQKTSSIPLL